MIGLLDALEIIILVFIGLGFGVGIPFFPEILDEPVPFGRGKIQEGFPFFPGDDVADMGKEILVVRGEGFFRADGRASGKWG